MVPFGVELLVSVEEAPESCTGTTTRTGTSGTGRDFDDDP